MKDYRLDIRVRNNRILSLMEGRGFYSVPKFCAHHRLAVSTMYKMIKMQEPAARQSGEWRKPVLDIATALRVDPDELFNERQKAGGARPGSITRYVNESDLLSIDTDVAAAEIAYDPLTLIDDKVDLEAALHVLSDRGRDVIARRFGLDGSPAQTYDEIACDYKLTRERIRQIELKALRALKKEMRARKNRQKMPRPVDGGTSLAGAAQ